VKEHHKVGLCAEFPSLSLLAESPEAALQGIRRVVGRAIRGMKKNGEIPPAPISNKSFSGKFVVRIPPEVHRALVIKAAEKGIILNRLVSAKLSCRRLSFYPYLTDSFFPCKFTWRLNP
jgi:predicted HicB family RNase H-like nuclease